MFSNRIFSIKTLSFLIISIAIVMALISITKKGSYNKTLDLMEVGVQEIQAEDLALELEYPARVWGSKEVKIRARVSGMLMNKNYKEGEIVKQGDVLFQIDPKPFEIDLNKARANLITSQTNLELAERNWDRSYKLYQKAVISRQEYESVEAQLKEAQSMVKQNEAELDLAQNNLDYTTIKSPITGLTEESTYSEGNLINAGNDSEVLTTVTQLDPLYISFSYADSDPNSPHNLISSGNIFLAKGTQATAAVKLSDNSVLDSEGVIDFTAGTIDAHTSTITARATFPNVNNKLMPGQFVTVIVRGLIWKKAIVLPEQAIMQSKRGSFVYLVDEKNKVAARYITQGMLTKKGVIVLKGLQAGDKVIIEGMIKAKPDNIVNPVSLTAVKNEAK